MRRFIIFNHFIIHYPLDFSDRFCPVLIKVLQVGGFVTQTFSLMFFLNTQAKVLNRSPIRSESRLAKEMADQLDIMLETIPEGDEDGADGEASGSDALVKREGFGMGGIRGHGTRSSMKFKLVRFFILLWFGFVLDKGNGVLNVFRVLRVCFFMFFSAFVLEFVLN